MIESDESQPPEAENDAERRFRELMEELARRPRAKVQAEVKRWEGSWDFYRVGLFNYRECIASAVASWQGYFRRSPLMERGRPWQWLEEHRQRFTKPQDLTPKAKLAWQKLRTKKNRMQVDCLLNEAVRETCDLIDAGGPYRIQLGEIMEKQASQLRKARQEVETSGNAYVETLEKYRTSLSPTLIDARGGLEKIQGPRSYSNSEEVALELDSCLAEIRICLDRVCDIVAASDELDPRDVSQIQRIADQHQTELRQVCAPLVSAISNSSLWQADTYDVIYPKTLAELVDQDARDEAVKAAEETAASERESTIRFAWPGRVESCLRMVNRCVDEVRKIADPTFRLRDKSRQSGPSGRPLFKSALIEIVRIYEQECGLQKEHREAVRHAHVLLYEAGLVQNPDFTGLLAQAPSKVTNDKDWKKSEKN